MACFPFLDVLALAGTLVCINPWCFSTPAINGTVIEFLFHDARALDGMDIVLTSGFALRS